MRRAPVCLLAGLILAGFLPHLSRADDDLPHVRCDGRRLMFGWHGGSPHKVDVSNLIRAVLLNNVRVLAAQRAGDVDYFIVTVSGPSRIAEGNSNSGGTESNLLWLKLKSWKLLDAQSMLYESSWDGLVPIGDYHLKSGVLTLRYANTRESTSYMLRYDSSKPDGKISIERASEVE